MLPRQLGNLKQLTFLDVSANSLKGELPTELGKLVNMKTLGLAKIILPGGYFVNLGE